MQNLELELRLLSGIRQPGETDRAIIACNDFLLLGRKRSLRRLLSWYESQLGSVATTSLDTLKRWSTRFGWYDRAAIFGHGPEWQWHRRSWRPPQVRAWNGCDELRACALEVLYRREQEINASQSLPGPEELARWFSHRAQKPGDRSVAKRLK